MTAFLRKLYTDFLYVPRHDKAKVREKVMLTRMALSVTVILLCMAAMSFTAYAFFTHTAYSGVRPVQAASWSVTVTSAEDIVPQEGVYPLDNTAGAAERLYTFTVAKAATATATVGYVKVEISAEGATQLYYTQPLGTFLVDDVMTEDVDRQIRIRVPAGKQVQVAFVGEWGSCSKEPILEESGVVEPFAANQVMAEDTTVTTTTTTTTAATTTATTAVTTTTVAETTTTTTTATTETTTAPAADEDTP